MNVGCGMEEGERREDKTEWRIAYQGLLVYVKS